MFTIIEKPVKFLGITLWHKREIKQESYAEGLERIKGIYARSDFGTRCPGFMSIMLRGDRDGI